MKDDNQLCFLIIAIVDGTGLSSDYRHFICHLPVSCRFSDNIRSDSASKSSYDIETVIRNIGSLLSRHDSRIKG